MVLKEFEELVASILFKMGSWCSNKLDHFTDGQTRNFLKLFEHHEHILNRMEATILQDQKVISKAKGDSGSPCLRPLFPLKNPWKESLKPIEKEGVQIQACSQRNHGQVLKQGGRFR